MDKSPFFYSPCSTFPSYQFWCLSMSSPYFVKGMGSSKRQCQCQHLQFKDMGTGLAVNPVYIGAPYNQSLYSRCTKPKFTWKQEFDS